MRPDTAAALSLALTMAVCSIGILRLIDLNEKEPLWALGLAVWFGAVAAAAAALVTQQRAGHETAWHIALTADIAKAAALGLAVCLLLGFGRIRGFAEINGMVDALIYGAAVGVGFAAGDTFLREAFSSAQEIQTPVQTGTRGLIWMSLQAGLSEALFGAILGAGIGVALTAESRPARVLGPCAALAIAVLTHERYVSWFLDGAPIQPDFTLETALASLVVASLVVGAILYGLKGEKSMLVDRLRDEDNEVVMPDEFVRIERPGERRRHYLETFRQGNLDSWLLQRWIQNRQVQLALTKQEAEESAAPEALRLREQAEAIRQLIRRRRARNANPPESEERDRWLSGRAIQRLLHARPASWAVAVATGVVLLGGVVTIAVATGDEAPTTTATRSSPSIESRANCATSQPNSP
jgi:RsiW-degrading membrane proteinase PrsW (M82 family)